LFAGSVVLMFSTFTFVSSAPWIDRTLASIR
jgi:hypothetical protein